jgi:hypothetical protein
VVDLADFEQRKIPLAVLGRPNEPRHGVARAQVETAYLTRADVDIVGTREIRAVRRAQEAEAVLQDLEHAFAEDVFAVLGVGFQDREDDVLLAGSSKILEAHRFGELYQRGRGPCLELGEIHPVLRRFELRGRNYVELFVIGKLFAHPAAATLATALVAATTATAVAPIAFAVAVVRLMRTAAVLHSGSRRIA